MFVVYGMPRSGTTLLAQCLNAHPALLVPDETDFMVPAAHAFRLVDDPALGRPLLADLIGATDRFDATLGRWLSREQVREVVAGASYQFDDIVASLYGALATAADVVLAGDKSPNDLPQSEILGQVGFFTERIKAIHLVRDPRDVMVSMARLGWLNGIDVSYARLWRNANLSLHRRLAGHPERYLVTRYEDVVADPDTAFRAICTFLDVDFEPGMVSEEARFSQFPEHKGMTQHAGTFRPIGADSVGRYADRFDRQALQEVDHLAGDALAAFGYPAGVGA
jgi:Sulfotransferase family